MTMFRNIYDCPCGTHWTDDWDCMCDDRCPTCNTSCSPTSSVQLGKGIPETIMADLSKMEDLVMKGILEMYGQSHKSNQGTITGRMVSRNMPWKKAFKEYEMQQITAGPNMLPILRGASKDRLFHELYGVSGKMVIMDDSYWFPKIPKPEEGLPYDPGDFYEDADRLVYGTFRWPSNEKDWERTRFAAGGETAPDAKKRAQLRAKRKKK